MLKKAAGNGASVPQGMEALSFPAQSKAMAPGRFPPSKNRPGVFYILFFGNANQFFIQVTGVAVSWAFAAVMTFVILKVIGLFLTLRATEEEALGLDVTAHGERGYSDLTPGSPVPSAPAAVLSPVDVKNPVGINS